MKKSTPSPYQDLTALSTQIHTYESILHLLHWDQETYMPPGGGEPRAKQIALLAKLIHEHRQSKAFKNTLSKLINLSTGKLKVQNLSKKQSVAVREWHREFLRSTKLPPAFIETFSQTTSEASQVWAEAKKANNFKLFAPFLEKIVTLTKKKIDILGFSEHPYDALLEAYEPSMTTRQVETLFHSLEKELKKLLQHIPLRTSSAYPFLHHPVPDDKQREIGQFLLTKLPVDPAYTRFDVSTHPFSIALHPHDSRITTRFLSKFFLSSIFSLLHETGHSLYEMGLPTEHFGTPLGQYVSLSIHESQSRWWEVLIGRSLPFWQFFYPFLQKRLPHLKKIPLHTFYQAVTCVSPSYVRTESDEVTYCLHVILRFEIEKMLISGKLPVADLPAAWNSKMKELFGICPRTDTEGCLQDIHWSLGDFGYFPTYALGNLFASHFFAAFSKQHTNWEARVAQGDFSFMREWLKTNIHSLGRLYNAAQLAKHVTGKPLSEHAYCSYLHKKYAPSS